VRTPLGNLSLEQQLSPLQDFWDEGACAERSDPACMEGLYLRSVTLSLGGWTCTEVIIRQESHPHLTWKVEPLRALCQAGIPGSAQMCSLWFGVCYYLQHITSAFGRLTQRASNCSIVWGGGKCFNTSSVNNSLTQHCS